VVTVVTASEGLGRHPLLPSTMLPSSHHTSPPPPPRHTHTLTHALSLSLSLTHTHTTPPTTILNLAIATITKQYPIPPSPPVATAKTTRERPFSSKSRVVTACRSWRFVCSGCAGAPCTPPVSPTKTPRACSRVGACAGKEGSGGHSSGSGVYPFTTDSYARKETTNPEARTHAPKAPR